MMNFNTQEANKITVVLNARAGRVLDTGVDSLKETIETSLGSRLHEVLIVAPSDLKQTLANAFVSTDNDCIYVGGGDGTQSMASELAKTHKKPFLPLPFGTENWLANDLGITPDLPIETYFESDYTTHEIDLAQCGNRSFTLCTIIGKLPRAFAYREKVRGDLQWYHNLYIWLLSCYRYLSSRSEKVEVIADGKSQTIKAKTIVVTNNSFDTVMTRRPTRSALDCGKLYLHAMSHKGLLSTGQFLTALSTPNWQETDEFKRIEGKSIQLRWKRPRKRLTMIDGEFIKQNSNLEFDLSPKSIPVLKPLKPLE